MSQDFTETRFDYSAGRKDSPELTITVGVSGCGKSTWAKSQVNWHRGNVVRLNRDDIRKMLFADVPWSNSNENLVRDWQMEGARQALQRGKNVIIDDTNCIRNTRQKWEEFAQSQHVKFRIVTFTVDLKTCIERDKARGETCATCAAPKGVMVGEGIIRKQHKDLTTMHMSNQHPKEVNKPTRPWFERTELLKNGGWKVRLPDAPWVLVDVDGTVATFTDLKTGEQLRGPFDEWKVGVDQVMEVVAEWVRALYPHYNICIVSGRHDFCGDLTCDWLEMHGIPFDHILMRYSNDNRSDAPVKEEILHELQAVVGSDHGSYTRWEEFSDGDGKPIFTVPKQGIAFVIDDRPRVVRMWQSMGIPVFPVRGWVNHTPGCAFEEAERGYRQCPDCGALEDF
jgi:predicted kinase